jgi:hypothetical protein
MFNFAAFVLEVITDDKAYREPKIGNTVKVTQATCREVTGTTVPSIFEVAFGPV